MKRQIARHARKWAWGAATGLALLPADRLFADAPVAPREPARLLSTAGAQALTPGDSSSLPARREGAKRTITPFQGGKSNSAPIVTVADSDDGLSPVERELKKLYDRDGRKMPALRKPVVPNAGGNANGNTNGNAAARPNVPYSDTPPATLPQQTAQPIPQPKPGVLQKLNPFAKKPAASQQHTNNAAGAAAQTAPTTQRPVEPNASATRNETRPRTESPYRATDSTARPTETSPRSPAPPGDIDYRPDDRTATPPRAENSLPSSSPPSSPPPSREPRRVAPEASEDGAFSPPPLSSARETTPSNAPASNTPAATNGASMLDDFENPFPDEPESQADRRTGSSPQPSSVSSVGSQPSARTPLPRATAPIESPSVPTTTSPTESARRIESSRPSGDENPFTGLKLDDPTEQPVKTAKTPVAAPTERRSTGTATNSNEPASLAAPPRLDAPSLSAQTKVAVPSDASPTRVAAQPGPALTIPTQPAPAINAPTLNAPTLNAPELSAPSLAPPATSMPALPAPSLTAPGPAALPEAASSVPGNNPFEEPVPRREEDPVPRPEAVRPEPSRPDSPRPDSDGRAAEPESSAPAPSPAPFAAPPADAPRREPRSILPSADADGFQPPVLRTTPDRDTTPRLRAPDFPEQRPAELSREEPSAPPAAFPQPPGTPILRESTPNRSGFRQRSETTTPSTTSKTPAPGSTSPTPPRVAPRATTPPATLPQSTTAPATQPRAVPLPKRATAPRDDAFPAKHPAVVAPSTPSTSDAPLAPATPDSFETRGAARSQPPKPLDPEPAAELPKNPHERKLRLIAQRTGVGFKGFCPVTLRDERDLVDSNSLYNSTYEGTTYFFSSMEAKRKFDRDPRKYAPAAGGNDVVVKSASGREIPGSLDYAIWYKDRLHLFSARETLETFVDTLSSQQ